MNHVDEFLIAYSLLANKADERRLVMWNLVPKHHMLWHLAQKSLFLNPRRNNCMMDESYLHYLKKVVASCASGTPMENVPTKVAEKHVWAMHFENV